MNRLFKSLRQAAHEVQKIHLPCCVFDSLVRNIGPEPDIRSNCSSEQIGILQHDCKMPAQILERKFANVRAADSDVSTLHIIETEQQIRESCLPCPGVP